MSHRYERVELPDRFVDLAKRRTAYLFDVMRHQDMTIVLASAYLQGASDAAETMGKRK